MQARRWPPVTAWFALAPARLACAGVGRRIVHELALQNSWAVERPAAAALVRGAL